MSEENLQQQPTIDSFRAELQEIRDSLHMHAHKGFDASSKLDDVAIARPRIGGGGLAYTIADEGIFTFGDGSDSDVEITSDTTLTADKYYDNLVVKDTFTLTPDGYRIFVKDTLIVAGTINGNGNNGGNGGNGGNGSSGTGGTAGTAGTAAAALGDGYLKGSLAGKIGGAGASGSTGTGNNGAAGTGA